MRRAGGSQTKVILGNHAVWLSHRIKDGDFTIRGLIAELAGRSLKIDYHSVWGFVHTEKLSFKKKRNAYDYARLLKPMLVALCNGPDRLLAGALAMRVQREGRGMRRRDQSTDRRRL